MNFQHKNLLLALILFSLFLSLVINGQYSFAEEMTANGITVTDVSDKALHEIAKKKSNLQQITIPIDDDITTKIYKNSDKSTDILLENVGSESSFSDEVISKEQLLQGGKITRSKHTNSSYLTISSGNPFLPWILLIILLVFQIFIFRLLGANRV